MTRGRCRVQEFINQEEYINGKRGLEEERERTDKFRTEPEDFLLKSKVKERQGRKSPEQRDLRIENIGDGMLSGEQKQRKSMSYNEGKG